MSTELKEIEAIDAHLELHESALAKAVIADASKYSSGKLGSILNIGEKLCAAVTKATPAILFVVKYALFWKPKWQAAIKDVLAKAAELCAMLVPDVE